MRTAIAFLALAVSLAAQTPRYPIQGSSGGGGGGATIASTTLLIKGDNAGNGIAAAGTDVCALLTLTGDVTSSAACATTIANAAVTAIKMVNAGVHTGDCTTTFPNCTITAGAITAAKMVNGGVFTGDVTTTFPAVTVAKVNGNTPGGTCTAQFARSIDSSGRPTCASIANADLPTLTYTPSIFGGANLIPDSSGNVFAEPYTVLSGTAFFAYNIMAFADTSTSDCMFTRWNVPINYTAGTTTFIVDWNTTATSGNAIWTVDYRDVSTATLAATTSQESLTVTTAASGTASARTQSTLTATAANFSAGDIVQVKVCRNGAGSDTIAATLAIHDVRFSYVGRP